MRGTAEPGPSALGLGGTCGEKWSPHVSGENWHEERERILKLLKAIESGSVTHIDEEGLRQLQALGSENTKLLTSRLAELNKRLGT